MTVEVRNWKGSIRYQAARVEKVRSVDDIVTIVRDTQRFPSPVRVRGSHHSTTRCIVAEGGTVIDITGMNRILDIDEREKTIRMEAGVLHLDAARELEKHGLQFFVNVELGNLTVGSGACGGTKDASYISNGEFEFGQVASYCIGARLVQADGSVLEVTEDDPELMALVRSSYGMLGVLFEVTYRVKTMAPMAVEHVAYTVDEFADRLDELVARGQSMMLYLFPFRDRVVVEYRYDGDPSVEPSRWQWRLRNWVWKTGSPAFGKIVTRLVPFRRLRSWIFDRYNQLSQWVITRLLRGKNTRPADQIIRYPETAGFASYTFSIWSFPQASYPETIRAYFRFCKDYFRENGYRCDLLNVGYRIARDRQSLFSYTRNSDGLTLDPVATGLRGWNGFLVAYNEFCIQHGGTPLFNQTRDITPLQAQAAFGPEIETFQAVRRVHDPHDRFYTPYFQRLFEGARRGSGFSRYAAEIAAEAAPTQKPRPQRGTPGS